MRVLGIDPGTLNLGYGVVDEEGVGMTMVDCGVLSLPSKVPVEKRLSSLYKKLGEIVARYRPDEVAIEEPFVAGNARSALAVGRAQAIAILAAANKNLPVFRYLPAQVKQQVTDYGGSSKEQVQEMVRLQLGLAQPPRSSDAADALAVAICHLHQRHIDRLLAQGK
jgi:crossover junction endodeoxyribonuclease RuvC